MDASGQERGRAEPMPSLDLIDEMREVRGQILKRIEQHAGKSGASYLSTLVSDSFDSLIEFADEERREWEKVIDFLMQKDLDDE